METSKRTTDFVAYSNSHPGGVLESELEARGISTTEFSKMSGIEMPLLNEVLSKNKAITIDIAQKIESALGIDTKFWLDYQQLYDTWPERRAAYEAAHPEVPRSKVLQKIQKSHKKATVKIDGKKDWQSVVDSIIEFVKGKGLGETQNLQITFDAQPA
ncbi:MAG: HigA family addiction module antidote protein [Bacteroidales bacterium]|nr:HigA family addiction module antidote protein [Bacteroidales bacterium]MBP5369282.1 HigA family addiction module antidote protein [Bacteroidales bacterium]